MNDTLATRISAPQDEASTADGRMTVVFTSSVTENQGQGYAMVFAQGNHAFTLVLTECERENELYCFSNE